MSAECEKILRELHESERLLKRADAHFREGLRTQGHDDIKRAFTRLAAIPPRVFRWLEASEESHFLICSEEEMGVKSQISNPQCCFQSPHIFHCHMHTPPFLRDQKSGQKFADIIGMEVGRATVTALRNRHNRFRKVSVIFVNHVVKSEKERQPYYDNDNLLIKRILDSIISLVAYDDAARYCTNLYTYEIGEEVGFSVFVVEEGHLREWSVANPKSVLAEELNEKSAI